MTPTLAQLRLFTSQQGWAALSPDLARAWLERFRHQSLDLHRFCRRHHISVLAFRRTMRSYFADDWTAAVRAKATRQTPYRLGRALEYRVRRLLEDAGFVVLRSLGSKSPVDLVAIRRGVLLLVQCKRSGTLAPAEWNTLYALADSVAAVPLLALMPTARGTVFYRLTGPKDGPGRQPMLPWVLTEAA
jgi:hypothetical protein